MNQDRQIIGGLTIALVAVMMIYVSSMPEKKSEDFAAQVSVLEPAAGDVVPGSVSSIEAAAAEPAVSQVDEPAPDKGDVYPVVNIYATEEECKTETSSACHFVKCEDAVAVGTETKDNAVENVCAENEKTGWRAVVPAPDKTAIPDVIAPPAALEE